MRLEYWSGGVLEYWSSGVTPDSLLIAKDNF